MHLFVKFCPFKLEAELGEPYSLYEEIYMKLGYNGLEGSMRKKYSEQKWISRSVSKVIHR